MAAPMPDPSMIPIVLSEAAMSKSRLFGGFGVALNIIAFVVFSGRMWTRSYPVFRMGSDDYVIIAAYIFVLADSVLFLKTIPFVFDRDPSTLTLADIITYNRYAVFAQPIWSLAMAAIKSSIALMLLRLETSKPIRRFLWANIALQVVLCTYNTLTQLLQCIPLHAAWHQLGGPIGDAKCWSQEAIRINTICVTAINVATDFIFALLPISFLRKVQRPLRERIIIGGLMALGIFAGVASIFKIVASSRFGRTGDLTNESIGLGMWSCIEELTGIIAACIPCLRSPFQRALEYLGIVSAHGKTTMGRTYADMDGASTTLGKKSNVKSVITSRFRKSTIGESSRGSLESGRGFRMNSMRSPDAQSEDDILGREEEQRVGEIWCTTELRQEEGRRMSKVEEYGQVRL